MTPNIELLPEPKPLHCGSCTACYDTCPTHAIDAQGFHRERCLRNWQLSGKAVPEELRVHMGSRLIGCDSCQAHCPHNSTPEPARQPLFSLGDLLTDHKAASAALKEVIGSNLALPNRVLAQACLLAGCSDDPALLEPLEALLRHPSPVVAEHANWAHHRLTASKEESGC